MHKHQWLTGILLTVITFFITSAHALAKIELSYNVHASYTWVPYYIQHSPQMPGIVIEIIPEILNIADIKGTAKSYPPRRTQYALDKGFLDFDIVSPSWFKHQKTDNHFVFSDPFLPTESYFVTLKGNNKNWNEQAKTKQQEIGTVLGYIYHNDNDFIRADFRSEKDLIKALSMGRIEAAIIGKYPAIYWSKELDIPIELTNLHSSGELVLRLRKSQQHLLPQINQAIAQLKQQGTIKAIVEKYAAAMPAIELSTE